MKTIKESLDRTTIKTTNQMRSKQGCYNLYIN